MTTPLPSETVNELVVTDAGATASEKVTETGDVVGTAVVPSCGKVERIVGGIVSPPPPLPPPLHEDRPMINASSAVAGAADDHLNRFMVELPFDE